MEVLQHRREVVLGEEGSEPHNTDGGGMDINTTIIDVRSLNKTKDEESVGNSIYFEDDTDSTDEFSLSKKNPRVTESDDKVTENKNSEISLHLTPPEKSQEKENKPSIPLAKGKTKHVKFDKLIEESDDDEDVIELEFEKEIKKLDTHTMYCPNCDTIITKVVLRKKLGKKGPSADPSTQQHDLLGCSSCYSVFVPSANCFSWFWLLGNVEKKDGAKSPRQELPPDANAATPSLTRDNNNLVIEQGDCFGLFRIFGNKPEEKNTQKSEQESSGSARDNGDMEIDQGIHGVGGGVTDKRPDAGKGPGSSPPQGSILPGDWNIDVGGGVTDKRPDAGKGPGSSPPQGSILPGDWNIDVDKDLGGTSAGGAGYLHGVADSDNVPGVESPTDIKGTQDSKSVEILKSIVYGGLMESIASLSVVSSAAASDAATLNIIAIGLANLIGGLFIIVHDLRDLKNDQCEGAVNKYQEQLGRRNNFILHAIFAVLSFLVFGLIPPVTYGFAFDKTNDKDLTIVAVAAASFLCIILLAIGKSYIQKPPRFYIYLKTIAYYVTTAVLVSGVSYAVGDLIKKLLENFGWFNTPSAFPLSVPDIKSTNPVNWASY